MAEEAVVEIPESATVADNPTTEDMVVETLDTDDNHHAAAGDADAAANGGDSEAKPVNGDANSKRSRDDEGEENGGVAKKQKAENEKSVEEERLEKSVEGEEEVKKSGEEEEKKSDPVSVGPKTFGSSVEIFDYFYKFLHFWPPNLDVNKYEHMALLDLLNKGHAEPEKKIGSGVHAFQVRYHPMFKSRCFFIVREDESVDDFSFRKCVDHILPLPENMMAKSDGHHGGGGGRGGRGGGGGGGGGRRGGRGGRGGRRRN